jgi:lipopolysaccharide transport system permease protein
MSQVYLPKYLFPMIVLVTNTIKFLIVFFLLLTYLVFIDGRVDSSWLVLPILIAVQFLLNAACASIVAAVVPFVPDLRIVITNALTLLLFLSGIFYDIGTFPDDVRLYFRLNPVATLIENYRLVLLEGELPRWLDLGAVALISGLGIWFAVTLLVRYDRHYPRVVYS